MRSPPWPSPSRASCGTDVAPVAADRTLADILVTGQIDALYAPRTPRPFLQRRPEVRRLFADPRAAGERYARETGMFPIMYVVVLRRDVYERRPWLAGSPRSCATPTSRG